MHAMHDQREVILSALSLHYIPDTKQSTNREINGWGKGGGQVKQTGVHQRPNARNSKKAA